VVLSDGATPHFRYSGRAGAERGGSGGGGGRAEGVMAGEVPELGEVPLSGAMFHHGDVKAADGTFATRSKSGTVSDSKELADTKAVNGLVTGFTTDGLRSGDASVERDLVDALAVIPEHEVDRFGDDFGTDHGAMTTDGRKDKESGVVREITESRGRQSGPVVDESKVTWADADGDGVVADDPFAEDHSGAALRSLESRVTRGTAISGKDDPIRSGAAKTGEKVAQVDELRRNLYKAEGNLNLGKFDAAKV